MIYVKMGAIEDSRNGIVRYSIVEGNTEFFEVDEASGDICLRNSLDREKTKEWKVRGTKSQHSVF